MSVLEKICAGFVKKLQAQTFLFVTVKLNNHEKPPERPLDDVS